MSAYLAVLVTVSALVTLGTALLYREDGAERMAFLLLLLYVSAVPLIGAVRDFDIGALDFDAVTGEGYYDASASVGCDAFEAGVRAFIAEEFSLDVADISVEACGFSPETVSADLIRVTLSGRARLADRHAIKEKIEKNALGGCEVKIAI